MQEGLESYQQSAATCLADMKSQLGGLLRSKGFFWLASQQDSCLSWSHAGVVLQARKEGPWFAAVPQVSSAWLPAPPRSMLLLAGDTHCQCLVLCMPAARGSVPAALSGYCA